MSKFNEKRLGGFDDEYAHDDGSADPQLTHILAQASSSTEGYLTALAALCSSRLLSPIRADDSSAGDGEIGAVSLDQPGVRISPAFTSVQALSHWLPDARPVPVTLSQIAEAALETAVASAREPVIIVNLAEPTRFVIESALVAELAQKRVVVKFENGEFGWLLHGGYS